MLPLNLVCIDRNDVIFDPILIAFYKSEDKIWSSRDQVFNRLAIVTIITIPNLLTQRFSSLAQRNV